ncbi:hypothetical protein [Labrys sp. KNU-23]|nr:hypothetical protein [Labrys sp. KNU-23]
MMNTLLAVLSTLLATGLCTLAVASMRQPARVKVVARHNRRSLPRD